MGVSWPWSWGQMWKEEWRGRYTDGVKRSGQESTWDQWAGAQRVIWNVVSEEGHWGIILSRVWDGWIMESMETLAREFRFLPFNQKLSGGNN